MKNTINLLSISAKPLTFWEKFYVWALTVGRYVVIITELIVLLAFFYKFKVDNDLAAVKNDMNSNISVLKSQSQQVKQIKSYQARAQAATLILSAQKKSYDILNHTIGLIPGNISISSLEIPTNGKISLNGSEAGVGNLVLKDIQTLSNTFKADNDYTNVALSNIDQSSTSNITNFSISMDIVKTSK